NVTVPAGPVSARSLNGVAILGVQQGHEVLVRASGPQAAEVLAALRDLADRDFDEPAADAVPPGAAASGMSGPGVAAAGAPTPAAMAAAAVQPAGGAPLPRLPGAPGLAVRAAVPLPPGPLEGPREPA